MLFELANRGGLSVPTRFLSVLRYFITAFAVQCYSALDNDNEFKPKLIKISDQHFLVLW